MCAEACGAHEVYVAVDAMIQVAEHQRVEQGCPDRGPRAHIWAPDRLFLGPLGLKYMH